MPRANGDRSTIFFWTKELGMKMARFENVKKVDDVMRFLVSFGRKCSRYILYTACTISLTQQPKL
jgi:hypothetical protein